MKLTFIGAAQTVTGSMHLLEVNGKKILLDCGMVQGKRKESFESNRIFSYFVPEEIDFIILSHSHIDHAGNIPNIVKQGFRGSIFCTHATKDLANLMLQDSAHIQEKDTVFVNKRRRKQGKNLFEPLYTINDVYETAKHFVGIGYHQPFTISEGITLTFYDAGHILGSAILYLEIKEKGKTIKLGFSGDLGRPNMPIIKDPEMIPNVDYFICESTYGGRFHDSFVMTESKMVDILKKAIILKSKIIVPSFSVGRTQELVYLLHNIFDKNLCERFPIFVDSPLSTSATDIFRLHPECFDSETREFLVRHEDPFGFRSLRYITNVEDSKALNSLHGPLMIISASGMAETGRILHHLANNIQNPANMVFMVGFCAEHTLGRRIVERSPKLKIFGEDFLLKANVVVFNSLSAHADSDEIISYCNQFEKTLLKNIFLVHGDLDQQEKLKKRLGDNGFNTVTIPIPGESFELIQTQKKKKKLELGH